MKVELCNCTNVLLGEIADRQFTQKSVALTYAMALASSNPTDWAKVNAAIIQRWSRSGLVRLKTMAWKHFEQRAQDHRGD